MDLEVAADFIQNSAKGNTENHMFFVFFTSACTPLNFSFEICSSLRN